MTNWHENISEKLDVDEAPGKKKKKRKRRWKVTTGNQVIKHNISGVPSTLLLGKISF